MELDEGIVPMPEVGSVPEVPGMDMNSAPTIPESEVTSFMDVMTKGEPVHEEDAEAPVEETPEEPSLTSDEENPTEETHEEPSLTSYEETPAPAPMTENNEVVDDDIEDLLTKVKRENDRKEEMIEAYKREFARGEQLDVEIKELMMRAANGRTM